MWVKGEINLATVIKQRRKKRNEYKKRSARLNVIKTRLQKEDR